MSTSIDEDFVPEEPEGIPTGLSGAEKFAAICLRNKTKNDIVYADLLAKQIAFDQKMRIYIYLQLQTKQAKNLI